MDIRPSISLVFPSSSMTRVEKVFWSPNLLMAGFLLSYAALDRLGYKALLSLSNKAPLKMSCKALFETELRCSFETELLHGSLKLSYKAP